MQQGSPEFLTMESRVAVIARHLTGVSASTPIGAMPECTPLTASPSAKARPVLLVGSAISDVQALTDKQAVRLDVANQSSSIGKVTHKAGGVSLNIALALRALGHGAVHLVSAVGEDGAGRELVELCLKAGIGTNGILSIKDGRTATVICVFNDEGEVVFSLADVSILEQQMTPASALACMASCDYLNGVVVVDGDLPSKTLQSVCNRAHKDGCTLVFDPATAKKAPRCVDALPYIDYVAPNVEELHQIANKIGINKGQSKKWSPEKSVRVPEVFLLSAPAVAAVLSRGARHVILTAGKHGAGIYWYCATNLKLVHCPALPVPKISSVNGAGDCLLGGFVRGLLLGRRKEEALALGVACAGEALQTTANVPPRFDWARLEANVRSVGQKITETKFNAH